MCGPRESVTLPGWHGVSLLLVLRKACKPELCPRLLVILQGERQPWTGRTAATKEMGRKPELLSGSEPRQLCNLGEALNLSGTVTWCKV